jgi:APA family basic amino acid/polyamine antiporter
MRAGRFASAAIVVRVGAALAALGVLLSLLVGVSRTLFAMAATRDLPLWLAAVHPRHQIPHRAELAVGTAVIGVLCVADVGEAIGFSSFNVLVYYAVANASALTLSSAERRWPRALSMLGLAGCALVAASLPRETVVGGLALLGAGLLAFAVSRALRHGPRPR